MKRKHIIIILILTISVCFTGFIVLKMTRPNHKDPSFHLKSEQASPEPRTEAQESKTGTPKPKTKTPASGTKTQEPRTDTLASRTETQESKTKTPASRSETSEPKAKTPASSTETSEPKIEDSGIKESEKNTQVIEPDPTEIKQGDNSSERWTGYY